MIGLTVCVNYSEVLSHVLPWWLCGLDQCVVVSDSHDTRTHSLISTYCDPNVHLYVTDAFYKNAEFNKGGALAEAVENLDLLYLDEWICLFDADIMPAPLWWHALSGIEAGFIYSAPRWQADRVDDAGRHDLKPIEEGPDGLCGYFLLFNANDPHLPDRPEPIFTSWQHAGNYDTVFTMRWPHECYRMLPLRFVHIGTERNWWGVGNGQKMDEMYRKRRRRGMDWQHERVEE